MQSDSGSNHPLDKRQKIIQAIFSSSLLLIFPLDNYLLYFSWQIGGSALFSKSLHVRLISTLFKKRVRTLGWQALPNSTRVYYLLLQLKLVFIFDTGEITTVAHP